MTAAYRLRDPRTGSAVVVRWPGVEVTGDQALARRVEPYLNDEPFPALATSCDPRTGERGSRVWLPERGSWEWLRASLGRAAERLGLVMLVDIP